MSAGVEHHPAIHLPNQPTTNPRTYDSSKVMQSLSSFKFSSGTNASNLQMSIKTGHYAPIPATAAAGALAAAATAACPDKPKSIRLGKWGGSLRFSVEWSGPDWIGARASESNKAS